MAGWMRAVVLGMALAALGAPASAQVFVPPRPFQFGPFVKRPQQMTADQFKLLAAVRRVNLVKDDPEALVKCLDDEEPQVRRHAIEYLVTIGEDSIEPLMEGAASSNPRLRTNALWALRRIGPKGNPALFGVLMEVRKDMDYQVRLNANALFTYTDERAIRPLIDALGDSHPSVRAAAADSLGYFKIEAEEAVPFLSDRLKDSAPEVRRSAASAIGRVSPWAVEFCQTELIEALTDRDPYVRSRASAALGNTTPAGMQRLLDGLADSQETVRNGCAQALVAMGGKAVPALVEVLKHDDPHARFWAAYALGRIGRPAEVAVPLLTTLASEDKDSSVRFYAHTAVGMIRR